MTTGDTDPTSVTGGALDTYTTWLQQQPLAARSRASYRGQILQYLQWLDTLENPDELLPDYTHSPMPPPERRPPATTAAERRMEEDHGRVTWAVSDYKGWMLKERRLAPRTVNLALAAVQNFYKSRGIPVSTPPATLPRQAPQALTPKQVKALRRAASAMPPRNAAIIFTFLHTGIRRAELAALQTGDVAMTARKGDLTVRLGKGSRSRTVPLNAETRKALEAWLVDRARWPGSGDTAALWLSRLGNPLSSRAIADVVTAAGQSAGIEGLTPHTLRHTFVTGLVRNRTDLVTVADLAGHARLATTRLYSLPTEDDRQAAVEGLVP